MSYAIILYLFFLFPILLGNLWIGSDEQNSFGKIYIYGYFTMFAVFELPGVFFVHRGSHLSSLTFVWMAGVVGMSVAVLLYMMVRRKLFIRAYRDMTFEAKHVVRRMRWVLCLLAFLGIFSVTMVIPSPADATAEIVGISYNTDTMYLFTPYTKVAYVDKTQIECSPIEMLYAVGAYAASADPRVVVHLLLPCFLIPLYFAIGWRISEVLFGRDIRKNGIFTALWGVFATIGMASVRNLAVGIFQNSWNGITLFGCCAVPLLFAEGISLWKQIVLRENYRKQLLKLFVVVVGSQLLYYKSIFLALVIVVMCGLAMWLEQMVMMKERNVGDN